jgi:hypothetical protein
MEIKHSSILHRVVSSIPIVGTALAILIEHTETGMAEHGKFIGLVRGVAIGLGLAVGLIAASEAAVAVFDIVRFKIDVDYLSHVKYAIGAEASRKAIEEINRPYYERHKQSPPSNADTVRTKSTSDCPARGPIKPCFWLKLGKYEKLHYVLGVHDGVAGEPGLWNELFRKDWSFGDTVEKLDRFYTNSANHDVTVIDAMREVRSH